MAEETKEEQQEEVQAIKLGDQEFTTDELEELVGKARSVGEFEEKQGQPWDEVVKSWGKRGERIGELKSKLEEYEKSREEEEKAQTRQKLEQGQELSPEEQAKVIREELQKHLNELGYVRKEEAQDLFRGLREGEKLLSRTKKIIRTMKDEGYPEVGEEDLLKYMADPANPKDPEKAYKLMFEEEIEKVKEGKIQSMKKKGMTTQESSTAGDNKRPKEKKITDENLDKILSEHLGRGE